MQALQELFLLQARKPDADLTITSHISSGKKEKSWMTSRTGAGNLLSSLKKRGRLKRIRK